MPVQARPALLEVKVVVSLDQVWPGRLRVAPTCPSRVCTSTCAVSWHPCGSTSAGRPVRENSVQQDIHPHFHLLHPHFHLLHPHFHLLHPHFHLLHPHFHLLRPHSRLLLALR